MDATSFQEPSFPDNILQCLLDTSDSSTLNDALQVLIGISRTDAGRSDLASKAILPLVLQLIPFLFHPSIYHLLLLALRLLRNLCAGETVNQNLFIEHNGVEIILSVINVSGLEFHESGYVITRTALQVLANVSLAGVEHQLAIWKHFYPDAFCKIARLRKKETSDPLSMVIYTCCDGSIELFAEFCRDPGLVVMAEIVQTASEVGFGEDWLKLLLSRYCLEESHFPALFTMLSPDGASGKMRDVGRRDGDVHFTSGQAILLEVLSEILNERLEDINIHSDFALHVLEVFRNAIAVVDFDTRGHSALPTGFASIDILGYSLTMLRDICARGDSIVVDFEGGSEDIISTFVSKGLLDLLLPLLSELELPSSIRRTMKPNANQEMTSQSPKVCPYKGFRRDIVAVIGNCAYRRARVQDEVRERNGFMLLLQQCVIDDDNPFLREWGIWTARNLLEGNAENQQLADLEIQGTVNVPELADLALRVEVDPNTRRPKLVNTT